VLNWSFPLYRLFGIQVRVHWTLPLLFIVIFIQGIQGHYLEYAAMGLGVLFVQVLCHEYGHAITARRLHVEAETIVLWPLGGYTYCGSAASARDSMLITFMGPATNSIFAFGGAAALAAWGLWDWRFLNPFHDWIGLPMTFVQYTVYYTFRLGVILTLFNLCVPAYPLDGGRILLVFCASKFGRYAGAKLATSISLPAGVLLTVLGLVKGELFLTLIGIQSVIEAYQIRTLATQGMLDGHPAFPPESDYGSYERERDEPRPGLFARWRQKRRDEAQRRRAMDEAVLKLKVDDVLEKVSREGIGSLTTEERRVLDEASRRERERER